MPPAQHHERIEKRYKDAFAAEDRRHDKAVDAELAEHRAQGTRILQERDRDFQAHGLLPDGYEPPSNAEDSVCVPRHVVVMALRAVEAAGHHAHYVKALQKSLGGESHG